MFNSVACICGTRAPDSQVVVQTPDGTVVAKVKKGSGGKYEAEVAAGVDLIAIIAIAQACVGGGNSAGALAGAGVI